MKNAPGECIFPEVFEVQYQFSFSSDAEESAILSSLKKKINDCSQSAFGWSTHQNLSGAKKKHKIEYHPYTLTTEHHRSKLVVVVVNTLLKALSL